MPRKPAAAAAAVAVSRSDTAKRLYQINCKNHDRPLKLENSSAVKDTCTVQGQELMILSHRNRKSLSISDKTRTKNTDGEVWKYRDISCIECTGLVGRRYISIPSHPQLEGKVSLFKDRVEILDVDNLDESSAESGGQNSIVRTDEQPQNSQAPKEQPQVNHTPEEHLGGQLPAAPSSGEIAKDILSLKRFCLILEEDQETMSRQITKLRVPQKPIKDLKGDLASLKSTFKTFEQRLTAVESSVQNRLTALESALQLILENQGRDSLHGNPQRADDNISRRSRVIVEIPVKRRHRSLSPNPPVNLAQQRRQNLSPPVSEEPIGENKEDTISRSTNPKTRKARVARSQPRQAESMDPPNAQEAGGGGGGGGERIRQARDDDGDGETGTGAETSIVISNDGTDDDDNAGYNPEHASKRARLSRKKKETKMHDKKNKSTSRGRPSLGAVAKQELRIDKPDEDEDGDDQGRSAGRTTRSKKS